MSNHILYLFEKQNRIGMPEEKLCCYEQYAPAFLAEIGKCTCLYGVDIVCNTLFFKKDGDENHEHIN